MNNSLRERPEIRMMVLVTSCKDVNKTEAILSKYRSPFQFLCRGEGTASSELMGYLGLGTPEKAVVMCVVLKSQVPDLFKSLEEELKLDWRGKGIAFTFPVSGVNMSVIKLFNDDIRQKILEYMKRGDNHMSSEATPTHSFLMVVINQGYSEEVMAVAREAGCTGGTVLHARRLGEEEPIRRWGISVQSEKEIIFILAEQEKKLAIMKAIGGKYGFLSEAQGIVISVPVDAVTGLGQKHGAAD
jgi:hypothetical protein